MLTAVDVRKRRILGAVSVAFGVLLIVLAIMAMTGSLGAPSKKQAAAETGTTQGQQSEGAGQSGSESSAPPSESEAPQAEKLPLTVLNGSGTAGLAAAAQSAFEAQQWPVAEVGNYTEQSPEQSTVYYSADDEAAKASAELLVSEFDQLTAAEAPENFNYSGLVVVLAGDWTPGQ